MPSIDVNSTNAAADRLKNLRPYEPAPLDEEKGVYLLTNAGADGWPKAEAAMHAAHAAGYAVFAMPRGAVHAATVSSAYLIVVLPPSPKDTAKIDLGTLGTYSKTDTLRSIQVHPSNMHSAFVRFSEKDKYGADAGVLVTNRDGPLNTGKRIYLDSYKAVE